MKREHNLDFTALLDVIMILLFIVLSGIGRKAQERETDLTAAESRVETLNESIREYKEETAQLQAENSALNAELDAVLQQYNDLSAITGYGKDYQKAYPAVLRRVSKCMIVCLPKRGDHSDLRSVGVDLYLDNTYDDHLEYTATYDLVHDYELSPEARRLTIARQELEMTKFLASHLTEEPLEYCYITIQYPVNDEYFSSLDMDIIEKAINNTQNEFGLKCYIEKAGVY